MKTWQLLVVGIAVLVAIVFLPFYESLIAGTCALVVVVAVAFGFFLQPRREIFYLRTTIQNADVDRNLHVEHDRLAVRVELARLWVLFVPTSLALAFLVVTAANGTTWRFSVLGELFGYSGYTEYTFMLLCRLMILIVGGVLSVWISERYVLRDAEVCSAKSVSVSEGRVSFMFVDRNGAYHGGEAFFFDLNHPAALARLVLYKEQNAELNKIGMGLLFHRLVIVGRGLTELDSETVASRAVIPQLS